MASKSTRPDSPITDPEAMVPFARDFIAGWAYDDGFGCVELGQRNRRPDRGRFIAIHAFAAHCHHLADVALNLVDEGRQLEAIPLIRS